jgi:hypothetical protein
MGKTSVFLKIDPPAGFWMSKWFFLGSFENA